MIEDLALREPLFVKPGLSLLEMLSIFQEGQCHLALVSDDPMLALKFFRSRIRHQGNGIIIGIVTLEDIIEKVIQGDIFDETDLYHPNIFLMEVHQLYYTIIFYKAKANLVVELLSRASFNMRSFIDASSSKETLDSNSSKSIAEGGIPLDDTYEGVSGENSPLKVQDLENNATELDLENDIELSLLKKINVSENYPRRESDKIAPFSPSRTNVGKTKYQNIRSPIHSAVSNNKNATVSKRNGDLLKKSLTTDETTKLLSKKVYEDA